MNNTDSTDAAFRLNWQYQLQTQYGLSQNQTAEFTTNWNELWWQQYNNLTANYTASEAMYQNEMGLAYWQWANSTYSQMAIGYQSWYYGSGNSYYMFPGNFEYLYFLNDDFYYAVGTTSSNWNSFKDTMMFSSATPGTNYEYLFCTYDMANGEGSDPPANSLFNIANMQALVSLGQSTPNIMSDNTQIFGTSFNLDNWQTLTTTLGFASTQQTYMLWLWLWNARLKSYDQGYSNTDQPGYIGTLASEAMMENMAIMQLEVPLFTFASYMNTSYAANVTNSMQDCSTFYTGIIGFDATTATALCADTSNTFNFVDNTADNQNYIQSSIALMSVYFYGNQFNTANANYYQTFATLTGWTDADIDMNFRMMGTGGSGFATWLMKSVYSFYNTSYMW